MTGASALKDRRAADPGLRSARNRLPQSVDDRGEGHRDLTHQKAVLDSAFIDKTRFDEIVRSTKNRSLLHCRCVTISQGML